MAWALLVLAGLFEIGMVMGLKLSEGFTKPWPILLLAVSGGLSFLLLSLAIRSIPAGTAYAIWTAIGASGAVVVGIALFHEPAELARIGSVALIIAGVIGLRLAVPG